MHSSAERYLRLVNKDNSIRRHLRQCLMLLSLVVVLSVSWGLKLTGITMAGEAFCGKEEHSHSEECPLQTLICELEESEAHMHTEACILRELICEEEEIPAHTHSKECLNKTFVCTLSETEGHTHGTECIEKELICQLAEEPAHSHEEGCYSQKQICPLEETAPHTHDDNCHTTKIICGQEESELHTHDESCTSTTLTCTLAETDGHAHTDACFETLLSCLLTETEGHVHSDTCYQELPGFICGLEEHPPHMHDDTCYLYEEGNFICGLEETEGHSHEDVCYQFGIGFGCGLTEADAHVHVLECITPETQFGCEKEISEGHTHADSCYDTLEVCPLEEHIHDESCYSDINADIETSDDWEMTLANITRSPSTAKNVLSVAQAQLGYTESILNFEVDENGIRRGITRYGQWYGNPYGDWSSMFTSFCLYYAGVDAPFNGGPEAMRLEWEQEGLFIPVQEYAPMVGHILFLDRTLDGQADATAIIEDYDVTTIFAIEGDIPLETEEMLFDAVGRTRIPMDDPTILGYGIIPDDAMMMVLPTGDTSIIATTTQYRTDMFTDDAVFVLYTTSGSNTYAFDGSGNAIPVYIDAEGNITSDAENPETLLWSFTASGGSNSYLIQNVSTGRYMHAFPNNGTGVTTSGAYPSSLITSGTGVKIRSNTEFARLDAGRGQFVMTQNQNLAAAYQFGIRNMYTVWLDGTCGGIMSLGGSPNEAYHISNADTIVLPTQWQSPDKYSYTLRGWYDVVNNAYYPPGAEVPITGDTVFYADWVASSYNIGHYNSKVADTVSTRDFVTTRMFDYNALFNIQSSYADVNVSASSHEEIWNIISSGANAFNGEPTLNYIFRDWDRRNEDITYPVGSSNQNTNGGVYSGLYSSHLRNILFSTGNSFDPNTGAGILGKQYLGTGDHLFQYESNPNHPNYGYYYYDSSLNAASYNQSAGRFYVYDYLECTSDSAANNKYSDFLPLNSPYANTNGQAIPTYSYGGNYGEYSGTTHYRYDAQYNSGQSSANNVGTNYFFGMSIDIDFYLPNNPGTRDDSGSYGNRDVYGKEMHFKFSGDDDVWVLVDGQLVLDIGGIHGIESGDINFSSGVVTVNGTQTGSITSLNPGDHTLTILYLERGSSQSNCAIYFNLAPRFSFSIQKEDILTQAVLNGAEFSVYTDRNCTVPAQLWVSKASHDRGDTPTNVFTVTNGVANMWGMGAGNTYYIRETKPPDNAEYTYAKGIICVSIDKQGLASYNVELLEEPNEDGTSSEVSVGFTVHGFRIDEQTQNAYIIATNAPSWVKELTSVHVEKKWNDSINHNGEYVTVFLTITEPDGTVRQIREVMLGSENNWSYTWENLPKHYQDGTAIQYGVQEVSVPGYMGTVAVIDSSSVDSGSSSTVVSSFENAQTYLLKTPYGYLAAANNQLMLVSTEAEALGSDNAQWIAANNSDGTIVLTNKAGQTLYYNNYAFRASSSPQSTQNLHFSNGLFSYTTHYSTWSDTQYPIDNSNVVDNITYNHILYSTQNSSNAMVITPQKLVTIEPEEPDVSDENLAFRITNTPLDEETSVTVHKVWDYGFLGPQTEHEQELVTVALLANGNYTGRTVTLSLKNSWTATFQGLPYSDSNGNRIVYTVEERWTSDDWIPYYGEIEISDGDPPTYSTVITNVNRWGTGVQLPSTGSAARMMYVLCGSGIIAASLVYGIGLRRKRERRPE
ncbi:MAG: Cna B-type domain-containing protein [Oscillospiraceae bacterium]|nr:Cna B-type domain-containing protein [Oscillospiraceae bacterium]